MRIATWNLAGRFAEGHTALIEALDADVLLLTEVSERTVLPGWQLHLGRDLMAARRRWAGVATRQPAHPLPDPHPATAAVRLHGLVCWSSVLPWRSCGSVPWGQKPHADRTGRALDQLLSRRQHPDLWGGDWNHALHGREWSGSQGGRAHVVAALDRFGLHPVTGRLPHRLPDLLSIDHVAVPSSWTVRTAERVDGSGLSDHDAYVIEVESTLRSPSP